MFQWGVLLLLGLNTISLATNSAMDVEVRVQIPEVEVANLEDNVDETETNVNRHDDRISSDTNNLFTAISYVDDIEDRTELVEERMAALEDENAALKERLNALESVVSGLQVSENATIYRLDSVELSVEELEETFDERISTLEELLLVPWNACSSSPCDNGATCIDVNLDIFICLCRDGYFGVTCSDSYSDTLFLATFDVYSLFASDPLVFNYPVLNPGGHYDNSTGIYTVPLDGIYEFVIHIWSDGDFVIGTLLSVDDYNVAYTWVEGDMTYDHRLLEAVSTVSLTAGQEVFVKPAGINTMYGANDDGARSWFSGHLLYAA